MSASGLRRWMAFGSGAGIEIQRNDLEVAVVRVRPSGARVLSQTTIAGYADRTAADWGAECSNFLRKSGAGPLAATVVLPRREVTVRVLHLPGVAARDLAGAIGYQIDSLHPYPEQDVVSSWAKLGDTPFVMVGITRAQVIEKYTALFAEAGIRVGGFSFSTAVLYSALRIAREVPPAFFTVRSTGEEVEVYGESPSRPVFSSLLDVDSPRARELALSELRIEETPEVLLPPISVAAATVSACPRLALPLNLLPEDQRSTASRLIWAPTAALGLMLIAASAVLAAYDGYEDRQYLTKLENEIARITPLAGRGTAAERAIEKTRARLGVIEEIRTRTHADLNSVQELTRILNQPVWLQNMHMSRGNVSLQGESDQAAALLKLLDASPLFRDSEFVQMSRSSAGEVFHIRANREGGRP